MRVRFYIEKRRGDDGELLARQRPIFMTVAFNGNRIMISTGKNVDLRWWDPERQRVREEHADANVLNNWFDDLKANASVVWKALAVQSLKPEVKDFKREFERLKPRFSGGFFDVFFLFIEEGSERWSSSTYKKVRSFYKNLKSYDGSLETPPVDILVLPNPEGIVQKPHQAGKKYDQINTPAQVEEKPKRPIKKF